MMRAFLVSLSASALLLILGGGVFLYSGLFNVAATDKHSAPVHWLLEQARLRSIRTHAAGIRAPAGLDDPEKVLAGSDHFAAHCAICHGAPGVPKGDIGQGLYPEPPNLAQAVGRYSPTELFWILKNGIKMTGMPAWNDHDDEELWAVVAFLEKLPDMSEQDYAGLVMANMMNGGHHHH
jgi:mono/diheme cytochrome c family protein